jgi:hypothetical protein
MHTGDTTDVTSTLTDLERKLVDLERELSAVAGGAPTAGSSGPPPLPAAPAETRDATLRVEDLRGEIAGLVRFRDQLEAAARELVTEYDRLVDRLRGAEPTGPGAPPAAAPAAPAPRLGPRPEQPAAAAPAAWTPEPLPAAVAAGLGPQAAAPPPAPAVNDTLSFVGAVVVDAGPFTDITTLQAFEQGLGRVEGAEDVYVRSFEGDRALIDVRLSNPVPLVQLLRESLPLPIIPREAGEGRLTVDVVAADSHGT